MCCDPYQSLLSNHPIIAHSGHGCPQSRWINFSIYGRDFVPVVSAALKELSSQHPDLHCTLVLGEEQELTGALACGSVDLALVSDHTAMSSVQYRDITLQPQSVDILDGTVEVSVLDQSSVHQRLLWHNGESRPYILKLIHLLCGQP